ncbi:DNA primase [Piscirickettsia litoralis]|uniref:DNA primase n=1 Tax=Piscirickettsia litoralis TaxID=1891921 RepID=A0ABX3A8E6_9GAMM|nr:DNA primase [Piscirickettsia litoralis]ODN43705.1 DNA primase [Piscirickettsia litoralis]
MAKRIPNEFIEDVLARTNIVDTIGQRVQLKKTGSNHSGLCPFHNEKSPSFTVSATKQFYYCFGCGASGNAINFIIEYEGVGFRDALKELADPLGLTLPVTEQDHQRDHLAPLLTLMTEINTLYRQQLRHAPTAIHYLKSRGLSGEIARDYQMGYIPPRWDTLSQRFTTRQNDLITTGMLIENKDRLYDRFRGRIMFPIRNPQGQTIAFGGRSLGDEKPKYLNSPETPLYHKGRELYGLYEALQYNKKLNEIIVVEGYMDVIALAQYDIRNAVATLGTAVGASHLQQLFRYTNTVTFCFDGDNAGLKAAWRALEHSLSFVRDGRTLRFLLLPEGEDPDSLVRQSGTSGFNTALTKALPLSIFMIQELKKGLDLHTLEGRAELVDKARPLLAKLPESAFAKILLATLAQEAGMNESQLSQLLSKSASPNVNRIEHSPPASPRQVDNAIARSLTLLLHFPALSQAVDSQVINTNHMAGSDLLYKVLEFCQSRPHVNMGMVLSQWSHCQEGSLLAQLAATDPLIDNESHAQDELLDIIQRLSNKSKNRLAEQLLIKAQQQALSPMEKEELKRLLVGCKEQG